MAAPTLPTLLIQGRLKSPVDDDAETEALKEWIPIDYVIDWFRSREFKTGMENRVLILKSKTASGKSTVIPPAILKQLIKPKGNKARGMIVTQPRRLTAVQTLWNQIIPFNRELRIGYDVGWSTGTNKIMPTERGCFLSATVGTLAAMLQTLTDDEFMDKWQYILIDETHERDMPTDLAIYMLKNLMMRNAHKQECPFIALMSATFDEEPLLQYFDVPRATNYVFCDGFSFGYDTHWWEGPPITNYYTVITDTIKQICDKDPDNDIHRSDILVFLTSRGEFTTLELALNTLNASYARAKKPVFNILMCDSEAVGAEDMKCLRYKTDIIHDVVEIDGIKYKPRRRVIIANVVAETGLTIDSLKYVIDVGYSKEIEYNPIYGIPGLYNKPSPQSRLMQRFGRVGRKFRGDVYPLYTKETFEMLSREQFPKILIEDLSTVFCDIVIEQMRTLHADSQPLNFNDYDIDMISPPAVDNLHAALEKYTALGFYSHYAPKWDPDLDVVLESPPVTVVSDDAHRSLTKLGLVYSRMGVLPEIGRMILAAYAWGVSVLDMITIAAYITLAPKSLAAKEFTDANSPPIVKQINWGNIYKLGIPAFIDGPTKLLAIKAKLLICDDMIDALIVMNAIMRLLDQGSGIDGITTWCNQVNVVPKDMFAFITFREEIIEKLITAGFDIFVGKPLRECAGDMFMTVITKIKHCIYDGFRGNMAICGEDGQYRTTMGLQVTKPEFFTSDEKKMAKEYKVDGVIYPHRFIYRKLDLAVNRKSNMYVVKTVGMSIMDGYVAVDDNFLNPGAIS